jgi:hypothetical protein
MAHNILSGAIVSPLQLAPPPDGTVHILSGNLSTSDGASILNIPRVSNATNNALITNVGGDANTLVCESNLTFDGSTLAITGDLTASINISASAFYGDGSSLTGISAGSVSGSARHYSTTGLETSGYLKVSGSSTIGALSSSSTLQAVGAAILGSTLTVSGALTGSKGKFDLSTGNIIFSGSIIGDGSGLTGIDSVSGSSRHYSATGFETSGYLKVSGSSTLAAVSGSGILHAVGASTFGATVASSGSVTSVGLYSTDLISGSLGLHVDAPATFGGTVAVTGAVSGASTLSVVGSISSSANIAVTGTMHATTYYGDGSNLTGIGASSVSGSARHYSVTGLETSGYLKVSGSTTLAGNVEVTGNIVPGTANTYDLGSAAKPWRNLYVSSSTIYLGTDTLRVENDNLKFGSGSTSKGFDVGFMNFVNNGIFMEQGRLFKLRAYQIQLFGGIGYVRNVVADDYTIKDTDYLIGIQSDTLSNSITLTLPGADALLNGQTFIVKDEGGAVNNYPVTVSCAGNDTIDGENKVVLYSPYSSIQIYCNGSNKFFIC